MPQSQADPAQPSPPPAPTPDSSPKLAATDERKRRAPNPARRITVVIAAVLVILFAYGIIADRMTPYTTQATVQGYLVQIAPEVAGKVIEIGIQEGEPVQAGDVLFRIDPERYRLAVERAEAQLELAGQNVGASTAAVAAAQAVLSQARAERENVREQTARVFQLVDDGVYPAARRDQAQSALDGAEAAEARAAAELEKARQSLGPQGEDNPQVRDAIAALAQAQLDLSKTTVLAPSDGGVPYLELAVGQVLAAGQAAMTYVDTRQVWIDAAFRENSLEFIEQGDLVDVVLDIRPGRIYLGWVEGFGYAVSNRSVDPRTGLPTIRNPRGWFRDPQPMPLRILFDPDNRPKNLRLGSQATVMVYAENDPIMDAIGRFWMRVVSWLTYVN